MKKSITIRVPEPCHEGWEKMTPTEKGRFCDSCAKEVIDFSKKRDEDLVKELAGKSNICGRFNIKQLDREVSMERKSSHSVVPWAASLLLPLTLMATNPTKPEKSEHNTYTSLGIGSRSDHGFRYQVTTSGVVRDASGKPLAGVEITVKESGKSELSGLRGDYEIKSLDNETLVFSKKGFGTFELKLEARSEVRDITLTKEVIISVEQPEFETMVLGRPAIPASGVPKEEMLEGDVVVEVIETKNEEAKVVKIMGTVTDEIGPLPGVNIVVKGTVHGTQTDFDGNYEIEADVGDELVFSYVGFITQDIKVYNNSKHINVNLEADDTMIEGMMVIGLVASIERRPVNLQNSKYLVEPEEQPFSEYTLRTNEERTQWRKNLRETHANEIEFKRIKQARKKAERRLKKRKRT